MMARRSVQPHWEQREQLHEEEVTQLHEQLEEERRARAEDRAAAAEALAVASQRGGIRGGSSVAAGDTDITTWMHRARQVCEQAP